MSQAIKILLLPGDGIGPEVIAEARKLLGVMRDDEGLSITIEEGLIGGASYDAHGVPLADEVLATARQCDAALMGAVGAPQYEALQRDKRPERGLLKLRSDMDLFANLRPASLFPPLANCSSLKSELVTGLDILIVRELVGGIYFGEPRGIREGAQGEREAYNTMVYKESEIKRVLRVAFDAAQKRSGRLCSVDKANVLEVSELWRETASEMAKDYPDVTTSHIYVDNAAMQLVRDPRQFDVLVTSNLFGDILSDLSAMLTGSIGMLPSASLNGDQWGLYEPVHGSAPDIANQGIANPLATLLSLAMACRYSLGMSAQADRIEQAVEQSLGIARTPDIAADGKSASTSEVGDAVVECYLKLLKE